MRIRFLVFTLSLLVLIPPVLAAQTQASADWKTPAECPNCRREILGAVKFSKRPSSSLRDVVMTP